MSAKYQLGDTVWFMYNNKTYSGDVVQIQEESRTFLDEGDITRHISTVIYTLSRTIFTAPIKEELLYPTKQALLNSL